MGCAHRRDRLSIRVPRVARCREARFICCYQKSLCLEFQSLGAVEGLLPLAPLEEEPNGGESQSCVIVSMG